jgi:deazaflavin-dependent oxidoreductase (nitroreductase family)
MSDYNAKVIEQFRARGGDPSPGRKMLLLHHTGAKSGTERVTPLVYQQLEGDRVAIFASKAGAPTNPDWFHNVRANPEATIEIGSDTKRVRARVADEAERSAIWEQQKQDMPQFAGYEETAQGRTIPVVVLEAAA